jgi:hypothetical protein
MGKRKRLLREAKQVHLPTPEVDAYMRHTVEAWTKSGRTFKLWRIIRDPDGTCHRVPAEEFFGLRKDANSKDSTT